jgi:hypothetical protein
MHHLPRLLLLPLLLLGGCPPNGPGGKLATPTFVGLKVPGSGMFVPATAFPPSAVPPSFRVLPVTGNGVQVLLNAPEGTSFRVSVVRPGTAAVPLAEYTGTTAPPGPADGYFQVTFDKTKTPPYTMYVRTPLSFPPVPSGYDINVISQGVNMTDSDPMVVSLRPAIANVTVISSGWGHVTLTPGNSWYCGTGYSGETLGPVPCTYSFFRGTVVLSPNTNDMNASSFLGWTNECMPFSESCTLNVDGSKDFTIGVNFKARQ